MPSLHAPIAVARIRVLLAAAVIVAAFVAGCAGGGLPTPRNATGAPSIPASPAPSAELTGTAAPDPGASVSPPAGDPGPPSAALAPDGGDAVAGELGGYTWAGTGSDAPWIVPPRDRAVTAAGPYTLALDPPLPIESWIARWAPVTGGDAGDPAGFADGGALPVRFEGPTGPGSWAVQVDVRFAGGGRAAWYWRTEIAP